MKTDANQDKLDAIAMLLIAIGESFRRLIRRQKAHS